jgi:large subunit ribosomal protein L24
VIRKDFGRRSFSLRKGDEVTVIKGEYKGRSGKVSKVNRQRLCVFIDGIKMRKVSGQEIDVPIRPANLVITRLYDEDKIRMKRIKRIVNQKIGSENKTDGKLR